MVKNEKENRSKTPARQAFQEMRREANKIEASTPYQFNGKNLGFFGGGRKGLHFGAGSGIVPPLCHGLLRYDPFLNCFCKLLSRMECLNRLRVAMKGSEKLKT